MKTGQTGPGGEKKSTLLGTLKLTAIRLCLVHRLGLLLASFIFTYFCLHQLLQIIFELIFFLVLRSHVASLLSWKLWSESVVNFHDTFTKFPEPFAPMMLPLFLCSNASYVTSLVSWNFVNVLWKFTTASDYNFNDTTEVTWDVLEHNICNRRNLSWIFNPNEITTALIFSLCSLNKMSFSSSISLPSMHIISPLHRYGVQISLPFLARPANLCLHHHHLWKLNCLFAVTKIDTCSSS